MQEENQDDIISIDFSAFFKILKKEKLAIIATMLLFIIIGGIYAYTAQIEFTTEGKILPELSSKSKMGSLGGLSSLAGLAGVNLDNLNSTDAIRPDLYPDIVNSMPFYLHLLKQSVTTKNGSKFIFQKFFDDYVDKKNWLENLVANDSPEMIATKASIDSNVISVTKKQFLAKENLQKRIAVSYDKKSGVISISVKMPDPVVAASVASITMNYITDYVTQYRTEKARQDLTFLRKMVAEAKGKYYGEQAKKAQYSDQTKYIALQAADLQRERIESDYKVSTSVYNGLLSQLEQAKIKVQEETPVLQVLDPPQIPLKKSEPKRPIILILFTFLGVLLGVLVALFRKGNYKSIVSK